MTRANGANGANGSRKATGPWAGAHVLLTGAGGAIGSAFARAVHARAPDVRFTLVDVTEEASAALARDVGYARDVSDRSGASHSSATCVAWDLSRPDDLPSHVDALVRSCGAVDVLVNCAGIMEVRSLASMPWDLGSRVMKIDLESPLRLMSLLVPSMIDRKKGLIVNVASMAGRTPLRGCTYYGAAKAGLAMASDIARMELEDKGVHVVTVLPGPVHSGLERHARAGYPESTISRLMPTGDPKVLARLMIRACEARKPRVVYPPFYDAAHKVPQLAIRAAEIFSPHPKN